MTSDFIGRGEARAFGIIEKMFSKYSVLTQVPIKSILSKESYDTLGEEHKKHKHDIVIERATSHIIVEVNYQHGAIAEQKWKVYKRLLESEGHLTVTIDDYNCKSLFQLDNGVHTNTDQDVKDVLNAFEMAGVQTC